MNGNAKAFAVVAAAVALAGLALVMLRRPPTPTQQSTRAFRERPDVSARDDGLLDLKNEVQLLRAELAGLKEGAAERSPAASAKARERMPPVEEPSGTPRVAPPRTVDVETQHARYEEIFAGQVTDSAWARAEEASIRDFVTASIPADATLGGVECRTSMCRLNVTFSDESSVASFKYKIGLPPLDHGGFYRNDPETHELTFYSARPGHPSPSLEDLLN